MLSDLMSRLKKWEAALGSSMPRVQSFISAKKKEKDKTEVVGNIIKAKTVKSRISRENREVETRLYFDERGLDKYYGLLELGESAGLWKNVAGRYEINGKKIYAKQIYAEPEKYFTDDILSKLDETAQRTFSYGEN